MNKNFILVYLGSDNRFKARNLDQDSMSIEVDLAQIEYFTNFHSGLLYEKSLFSVFSPIKGSWDALDYDILNHDYVAKTIQNEPSHRYFGTITEENIRILFDHISKSIIHVAMVIKSECAIIH